MVRWRASVALVATTKVTSSPRRCGVPVVCLQIVNLRSRMESQESASTAALSAKDAEVTKLTLDLQTALRVRR